MLFSVFLPQGSSNWRSVGQKSIDTSQKDEDVCLSHIRTDYFCLFSSFHIQLQLLCVEHIMVARQSPPSAELALSGLQIKATISFCAASEYLGWTC